MRKRIIINFVFAAVAAGAFGAGSIVSSFPSPFWTFGKGLDFHGGYIYHVTNATRTCYQTTTTGSIVRSITFPNDMRGVHFTGSYFWASDNVAVYRLDTNGSVLNSFATVWAHYGLTFDGTYIWGSTVNSGNLITKMTTEGSVVSSFEGPGSYNGDLDWDSGYLWVCDWPVSGGGLYRITTTGSVVESYVPPSGPTTRPSGCCWDGDYLWFLNFSEPRYVYQIDTARTSITPTSIGKVKALFR